MLLNTDDYRCLLALYSGRKPSWDMASLQKCADSRLVSPHGDCLLREGRRKAEHIKLAADMLLRGAPLDRKSLNRSSEIANEPWYYLRDGANRYIFNAHAVFLGSPPFEIFRQRAVAGEPMTEFVRKINDWHARCRTWSRIRPYCIQRGAVDSMETLCFAEMHYKTEPRIIRVQTRYYDYAVSLAENRELFWWTCPTKPTGPVVFTKRTTGGLLGAIQPVITNWPAPVPIHEDS